MLAARSLLVILCHCIAANAFLFLGPDSIIFQSSASQVNLSESYRIKWTTNVLDGTPPGWTFNLSIIQDGSVQGAYNYTRTVMVYIDGGIGAVDLPPQWVPGDSQYHWQAQYEDFFGFWDCDATPFEATAWAAVNATIATYNPAIAAAAARARRIKHALEIAMPVLGVAIAIGVCAWYFLFFKAYRKRRVAGAAFAARDIQLEQEIRAAHQRYSTRMGV